MQKVKKGNKRHTNDKIVTIHRWYNYVYKISPQIYKINLENNKWVHKVFSIEHKYRKLILFLYTSDGHIDTEFKSTPFTITQKWNYLGILLGNMYRTWVLKTTKRMKEIEERTHSPKSRYYFYNLWCVWASLMAQLVKTLPAKRETRLRIPGLGRFPLQYSGLENSTDCCYGVAKSHWRLKDFHFQSLVCTWRDEVHLLTCLLIFFFFFTEYFR